MEHHESYPFKCLGTHSNKYRRLLCIIKYTFEGEIDKLLTIVFNLQKMGLNDSILQRPVIFELYHLSSTQVLTSVYRTYHPVDPVHYTELFYCSSFLFYINEAHVKETWFTD